MLFLEVLHAGKMSDIDVTQIRGGVHPMTGRGVRACT